MRRLIFAFVIAMLFLAGCQALQFRKEGIKPIEAHIGTQGVDMLFLDNAPPNAVFENSPFNIILQLENKGASDLVNGFYSLSIEEEKVNILEENIGKYSLKGKSVYSSYGEKKMVSFKAQTGSIGPEFSSAKSSILATTCYPYRTEATANVCIDTDILQKVKTKVCKTAPIGMSGGQGAPVGVASVNTMIVQMEDKEYLAPQFEIRVQNFGNGRIVAKDKVFPVCSGKPKAEYYNVIEARVSLSDEQLSCIPEVLNLEKGQNTLRCVLDGGISKTRGTYTAQLLIELDYGYVSAAEKTITITKIQ